LLLLSKGYKFFHLLLSSYKEDVANLEDRNFWTTKEVHGSHINLFGGGKIWAVFIVKIGENG